MSGIVQLLNEKNEHLERFLNLNAEEIVNMHDGNFENLDTFYSSRDCILNMVSKVDKRIEDVNRGLLTPDDLSADEKKQVLRALDRKNDLVQQILAQDLQILSLIESEKSEIIRELKKTSTIKKVFSSYKSEERKTTGQVDESA